MIVGKLATIDLMSPSSRRAWIEILARFSERMGKKVALLAEGVDRNWKSWTRFITPCVALLAEGVDRNSKQESY